MCTHEHLIKELTEEEKERLEKEKRKQEFLKTTESKIKKSEKDIWMVKNLDHLFDR